MPNGEAYKQWKAAIFGSDFDIWHDGLDVSLVQSLSGDARTNALSKLREGVDLGDSHAATALAAMGEDSAVSELKTQLAQSRARDKVRIALAIHALSPDESMATELVEVLQDPSLHWGDKIDAAIGLRNFGDLMSEKALLEAVGHSGDYLVRYHASDSLLSRWHVVPPYITKHREIFNLITNPPGGTTPEEAQGRLREAVVHLEQLRKRDE